MKVAIALNTTWNLVNFRSGLIRALLDEGHEVIGVAPEDEYVEDFIKLGCRHVAVEMENQGTSPVDDFGLFLRFFHVFKRERPHVLLAYTVKPNVYASLAAHLLGIPVINNIAGLGAVFISQSLLTRLVKGLYALALSRSSMVFFQNEEDRAQFVAERLVRVARTDVLPGSGIDLQKYAYSPPLPDAARAFRFLLVARMLWDKGIGEFVEAARRVRRVYPDVECCLLGFLDVQNPAAIPRSEVEAWVAEGVVRYLGVSREVDREIIASDCVVLPSSYREGTPRSLLEAAAIGRPLITTDTPGCRNVVDEGLNGYLCKVRDAASLADAMIRMIEMRPGVRLEMGVYGRKKMEREYDEQLVIGKYLQEVERATVLR